MMPTEGEMTRDQVPTRPLATGRDSDHYTPSLRLLKIAKKTGGACGFHLTRSKWDPYPWVSRVDADTPAHECGLKPGDCVLEVNGDDVLGQRIADIAKLVRARPRHVTLLLWNSGYDDECDPEGICCGPMPRSLQRLSAIVQSILSVIECPVCLNTISPPAMQCQNGHLLCLNCRIRAEKCPVCRDRYTPRRALIAEQIYTAITNAFRLCCDEEKLREKLFGPHASLSPKSKRKQKLQQRDKQACETPSGHFRPLAAAIRAPIAVERIDLPLPFQLRSRYRCSSANDFERAVGAELESTTHAMDRNSSSSIDKDSPNSSAYSSLHSYGTLVLLDLAPRPPAAPASPTLSTSSASASASSMTTIEASAVPVGASSSSTDMTFELSPPPPPPTPPGQVAHKLDKSPPAYRCPLLECDKSVGGPTALQRHVHTAHQLPLLAFGSSKAHLTLPLRPPLDNALLVLELQSSPPTQADQTSGSVDKVGENCGQQCWIRLRTLGGECLEASALLQPALSVS